MLVPVLIGFGLVLGLVLGRWWALLAVAAVGLWVGLTEEVEVPGWFLRLAYAGLSGLGITLGVLVRRRFAAHRV